MSDMGKKRWKMNEWAVLALAAMPSLVGVVLFGFTLYFYVSVLFLPLFAAAILFFTQGACSRNEGHPPAFWAFVLTIAYVGGLQFFAKVPLVGMMNLLQLIGWLFAYWIWTTHCRTWSRCRWIWAAVLVVLSAICWYAVWRHFTGNVGFAHDQNQVLQYGPSHYKMRASGTFVCPNHFASAIVMGMCVAGGLLSMRSGWGLKLLSAQYLIVALPCLVQSGSRSGWIGVVVGLSVLFGLLLWKKSKLLCVCAVVLFLLGVAGAAYLLWKYVPFIQDRISAGSAGRLMLWPKAIEMIKDKPVTGFGAGMFRYAYQAYKGSVLQGHITRYAHNEYLHIAAETGLVGLGLSVLMGIIWYVRWVINYVRSRSWEITVFSAIALSAMSAALAHAVFDFNLTGYENGHLLILIVGTATGVGFVGLDRPETKRAKTALAINAFGGVGAVVALGLSIVLFMNMFHGYMGNREFYLAKDHVAALERYDKAESWYAGNWRTYYDRGAVHRSLAGDKSLSNEERRKHLGYSLSSYTRCYEANPYFAHGIYKLSSIYAYYRQPELQKALLEELISLFPDRVYWGVYFKCLKKMDDSDAINEACRLALQSKVLHPGLLRSILKKEKISGVDLKAIAKEIQEDPQPVPRRIFVADADAMTPLYSWEWAEDGSVINWDHALLKKD